MHQRLHALVAAALLASSAAGQEPAQASEAERASHARMLQQLAGIARATDETNPYLGDAVIRQLESELAALPAGAGSERLAELHFELGTNLLRVGRPEPALEHLQRAHELILPVAREERPRFARGLAFEIGVAWMRLGESRNCLGHHTSESCILPIRGSGLHVEREGSEQAIRWLRQALAEAPPGEPGWLAAKWLLNIAHMTLGSWPAALAPEERIEPAVFAARVEFPRFTDVAREAGVDLTNLAGGVVADDLDLDGRVDLLISDWDPRSQVRFLHNAGTGRFEERTQGSGLEGIGGALNMVPGDCDGDGRLDVLMLRGAWWGAAGRHPNSLLRNLGGGRFVDVTHLAGLAEPAAPTQAAACADYDLDGDLDLYVGNECSDEVPVPAQLFRNDGAGRFVDVAAAAGVANDKFAKGVAFGDYDGDRFPDLYVSNLGTRNRLYRNQGDGSFENVAGKLGVTAPQDSFACWFWDHDNDGALDLYVTSYTQALRYRLAPVVASYLGLSHAGERACLYRNDGRGGFDDVTEAAGLAAVSLPMGVNFGDLDNDGFLDFYLGTGYPGYDGLVPNVMYWNRGGTRFEDVSVAGGFGHLQKGHGVAFADFDDDGDQDVFEQMGGAYPGDPAIDLLFANPGSGRHWLELTLRGKESVRCALGARIRADFHEGEERRSVYRSVSSGGSFGASPLTQHLGLGTAQRVDVLAVTWPRSGATQTFRDVPVDVHLWIEEGAQEFRVLEERRFALGGGSGD